MLTALACLVTRAALAPSAVAVERRTGDIEDEEGSADESGLQQTPEAAARLPRGNAAVVPAEASLSHHTIALPLAAADAFVCAVTSTSVDWGPEPVVLSPTSQQHFEVFHGLPTLSARRRFRSWDSRKLLGTITTALLTVTITSQTTKASEPPNR